MEMESSRKRRRKTNVAMLMRVQDQSSKNPAETPSSDRRLGARHTENCLMRFRLLMTLAAIHVVGDIGDCRWRTMVDFAVGADGSSLLKSLLLLSFASSFLLRSSCCGALLGSFGGSSSLGFVSILVVGPRDEGNVRRCWLRLDRCVRSRCRGIGSCWGRTCTQPGDRVNFICGEWRGEDLYVQISRRGSSQRKPTR